MASGAQFHSAEFVEAGLSAAGGEPGEQIGEIGLRVDAGELAGLANEAIAPYRSPPSSLPANRAAFRDKPPAASRAARVYLDAAVLKKPLEPVPVVQREVDRVCCPVLRAELRFTYTPGLTHA